MDSFSWRQVAGAAFLLFGLGALVAPGARAAQYALRSEAMAACHWQRDHMAGQVMDNCSDHPQGTAGAGLFTLNVQYQYYSFDYAATDPPFSCNNLPTVSHNFPGKLFNGYNFPESATDPATGATTQCTRVLSNCSPPVYDVGHGQWGTFCTASPTGGTSGGPGWNDGVGPTSGIPGPPSSPLAPEPPPPKVCDGVSCYDPGQDKYCAGVEGGGQVCVPGSSGRGGGGCASSGGSTLCAGAPQPPAPPSSQVPDPPSQINGAGSTTHATPPTPGSGGQGGGIVIVHTTTYGAPGSSANNGAGSGDSQPAPPSSSGGAGTFGGGGSCATPPACTGDAVLCGIARTQWATTCQVHNDLAGTGPAPSLSSLGAGLGQGDVWAPDSGGSDGSEAGEANEGRYNESGFGAPQSCPLHDLDVPLWDGMSFTVPFEQGCTPLGWIRYLVLAFALFWAARITMGSAR